MEQQFTTIQKGSGVVYARQNMLYRRVKTEGNVKYVKCSFENFDGSAKIVDDKLFLTECIKCSFTAATLYV